jgi:hypothetical protein
MSVNDGKNLIIPVGKINPSKTRSRKKQSEATLHLRDILKLLCQAIMCTFYRNYDVKNDNIK